MTDIRSLEQTLLDNLPWNKARIKFVARFHYTSVLSIKNTTGRISRLSRSHKKSARKVERKTGRVMAVLDCLSL
jgi:hypothetical protein